MDEGTGKASGSAVSDSEAVALMNAAFDAAYRAVEEQTA